MKLLRSDQLEKLFKEGKHTRASIYQEERNENLDEILETLGKMAFDGVHNQLVIEKKSSLTAYEVMQAKLHKFIRAGYEVEFETWNDRGEVVIITWDSVNHEHEITEQSSL